MNKVRGYTKEGEKVYGWYVKAKTCSVIIPQNCHVYEFLANGFEVVPETVGEFVTKDKNKKDVYAGDRISFILAKRFKVAIRYTGVVYYCEARLAFCVNAQPAWDLRIRHNCDDIELIEDKDNE